MGCRGWEAAQGPFLQQMEALLCFYHPTGSQSPSQSHAGKAGTGGWHGGRPATEPGRREMGGFQGGCSSPFAGDTRTDGAQPAGDTGLAEHLMGMAMAARPRVGMALHGARVSPGAGGMGKGTEKVTSVFLRRWTTPPAPCHWLLPLDPTAVPLCASVSPTTELRHGAQFSSLIRGAARVYVPVCAHSCDLCESFSHSPNPDFPASRR